MNFVSTRGGAPVAASFALQAGIAPDGGLYVPTSIPALDLASLPREPVALAAAVLAPWFADDALAPSLPALCAAALDLPAPVVPLADGRTSLLELFHGPTAAFKDFGARFLAAAMPSDADRPATLLVATSGDTGGAVAAAFWQKPRINVYVLYPDGRVSPRQAHQLACWGANVQTFAVDGDFDACQALVKAAFTDPALRAKHRFTSANSINIGRLLPQITYYARASLAVFDATGDKARFVIPTGNLGNAVACLFGRAMGLPIAEIVLATNANRTLPDWLATGTVTDRATIPTLANAMDVSRPSNLERLLHPFPGHDLIADLQAFSIDDDTITSTIRSSQARYGAIVCPHTAAGLAARERLDDRPWIVAATAHAAKFDTVVEPLIDQRVPVPPGLAELLARPARVTKLAPTLSALAAALT